MSFFGVPSACWSPRDAWAGMRLSALCHALDVSLRDQANRGLGVAGRGEAKGARGAATRNQIVGHASRSSRHVQHVRDCLGPMRTTRRLTLPA